MKGVVRMLSKTGCNDFMPLVQMRSAPLLNAYIPFTNQSMHGMVHVEEGPLATHLEFLKPVLEFGGV